MTRLATREIDEYVVARRTVGGIEYRTIAMLKSGHWYFITYQSHLRRSVLYQLLAMADDPTTDFTIDDAAYVARDVRAN